MSVNTRPSDFSDGTAAHTNYQPQGRAEVRAKMPFNPYTGLGQALFPQAVPVSGSRHKPQGRWRDYGTLLGIWLLVVLVAGVIGIRMLDLSAGANRPDVYGRASATPATRAGPPALSASRPVAEEDPFDDPPLGLSPPPPAPPAALSNPTASAAAALQLSSDIAFRTQQTANPASAPVVAPHVPARPAGARETVPVPAACAPALSAMQLCGEIVK
jgi:hypothetical protein